MKLAEQFKDYIRQHQLFGEQDHLLLAVSGGVDSVVLCELCRQAGYAFSMAHCNFQLRGEESDRDEQFVRQLAARYNVPLFVKSFDTKQYVADHKCSKQEAARELRYAWFDELQDEQERAGAGRIHLLTAHHADDNIETAAMNYFRGTGVKGLRGMLPRQGRIIRPLLFARRKEIEDFAWLHQLEFVTDSSNLEEAYARNFFRLRLIPLFKAVYPEVEQNLLHNLERFAEVETLYEEIIALHRKKLVEQKGNEYHIPVLKLKKTRPLRTVVYEIFRQWGFTAHQAPEVMALLESETGKYVASATHRVFRNRNWLVISPGRSEEADHILVEEGVAEVVYPGGRLLLQASDNTSPAGADTAATLDARHIQYPLLLRKWKAGDYFYPLGMKKKKKVSRFLIDKKLSLTEKEKVWVVESGHRIIWVVGQRIDERFKVTGQTRTALRLQVQS